MKTQTFSDRQQNAEQALTQARAAVDRAVADIVRLQEMVRTASVAAEEAEAEAADAIAAPDFSDAVFAQATNRAAAAKARRDAAIRAVERAKQAEPTARAAIDSIERELRRLEGERLLASMTPELEELDQVIATIGRLVPVLEDQYHRGMALVIGSRDFAPGAAPSPPRILLASRMNSLLSRRLNRNFMGEATGSVSMVSEKSLRENVESITTSVQRAGTTLASSAA